MEAFLERGEGMKVYLVCCQHEPCCPTKLGVASRHRKVAVEALHNEFMDLIYPEGVNDFHGYEVTKEDGLVAAFWDVEGSDPSGHIEELEVEDE